MISFNHAVNLTRQLGEFLGVAQPHNPVHRDHWGHVADDAEGREELRRRCRAIFDAAGKSSQWSGEERIRLLAEYAQKEFGNG